MATFCLYSIFNATLFSCFILFFSASAHLPPPPSHADILLSFKDSIEDSKKSLSSWSNTTTVHYCNWIGVTCTASYPQTFTSLNLQSLNLSSEISPSVCKLPNLAQLDLANNLFHQSIPLHLSQCDSLETLNLSNNLIWGTIPDQIRRFRMPENAKMDQITVAMENGELTITVPKEEIKKPDVKVENGELMSQYKNEAVKVDDLVCFVCCPK